MFREMEKLVMLLDIYEEEVIGVHSVGEKITDKEETRIISKKFGFIKWLVENDKIDFKKIISEAEYFCNEYYQLEDNLNWTLMLLSIQDNPIEFLVSILK